ncbi:MAG: 50S ribosomal protein L29 [Gaiellaceae bacterium]
MPSDQLRDATDDELAVKERELTESLFFLRLRHGTNQLESPAKLKQTRREIARVKTIRRARELAAKG